MSEDWPAAGAVRTRRTGRWRGLGAVALTLVGLALFTRRPALLALGGLAAVLAAYARLATPPIPTVAVERTVSGAPPETEGGLTVSVTVTNTGERTLPAVRITDGVPSSVAVADGSPERWVSLRPGQSAGYTYTLEPTPGETAFDPSYVAVRDVAGVAEHRTRVAADGNTDIDREPTRDAPVSVPLPPQTARTVGPVASGDGGEGVAFHAVRQYRRGDPLSRIDWRHRAKTGELATVEYREERTVTVALVVDARPAAAVAPSADATTAVEHSASAATELAAAFDAAGHSVGVTALGASDCWLPPGMGETHRRRAADLLATHPAFGRGGASLDTDTDAAIRAVRGRLPGTAQVVLLTPLCDDGAVTAAKRLAATGRAVTVLSPDPTTDGTAGETLAAMERTTRLRRLRAADIPTYDWDLGTPLAHVLGHGRRS